MEVTIHVSHKELHRARVLEQVLQEKLGLAEAGTLLGIGYRQVRRVMKRYRDQGLPGLVHQNRGRPSDRAVSADRVARILALHDSTYADINDSHFTEMLAEREGITLNRGTARRSYARATVLVRQHLDGAWTVWYKDQRISAHKPTPLTEPVRTWKRRAATGPTATGSVVQVYINSKPAPPPRKTFSRRS